MESLLNVFRARNVYVRAEIERLQRERWEAEVVDIVYCSKTHRTPRLSWHKANSAFHRPTSKPEGFLPCSFELPSFEASSNTAHTTMFRNGISKSRIAQPDFPLS